MTRVFIIRHAEAEGNLYRRAHGQYDGQITDKGYLQIERLKKRFETEKIDAVYSSDLFRAATTASALYKPRGYTLTTDKRLREVDIGSWEDRLWGDIEHEAPGQNRNFGHDPANWHVDGSEDYMQVRARMTECITQIARRHDGETVAVFSHGFAIRSFMCGIMGIPSHETHKVPYCDNTAVALLIFDNDKLTIDFQGDNSHLSVSDSTFAKQTWWRENDEWKRENLRAVVSDRERDAGLFSTCFSGEIPDTTASFTAMLGDTPVGLLGLNTGQNAGEDAGRIEYIFILPEHRRQGQGVQLIGHAISELRKLGRSRLQIAPPSRKEAEDFLSEYGFVKNTGSDFLEKDITKRHFEQ